MAFLKFFIGKALRCDVAYKHDWICEPVSGTQPRKWRIKPFRSFANNRLFLEFGDFGIAELLLLNLKRLLKQRHHLKDLA